MHEPFLPLPLPRPPENGNGTRLARVARRLAAGLPRRRDRSRESGRAAARCATSPGAPRVGFPFHPPGF